MATQHYVFLCDTARRERQELLTKVHKRFKTPSSETLLFNASRVSYEPTSPTALPTVSRLGMEVCLRAQSVSTRHGVCICAYAQSISPHRCVYVCVFVCVCAVSQHPLWCACVCCVVWSVSRMVGCFFRCALRPSLQQKTFLHFQAGSVEAWHARRFHRLISSFLCKTEGVKSPVCHGAGFLGSLQKAGLHTESRPLEQFA